MKKRLIKSGFNAMLPITTGIIPFGLVMGTVASSADLSFLQAIGMNVFVFAGAAQLASIDLMTQGVPTFVIVITGLIINMRFLLYSAAISPYTQKASTPVKLVTAYCLTDQAYAVMAANESRFQNYKESLIFYFGASMCMLLAWYTGVILGYVFGNVAPKSLSLEYAVPLSFVALVIPTIKSRPYLYVALSAAGLSIVFHKLPFNLGLLMAAILAIGIGAWLTRKRESK